MFLKRFSATASLATVLLAVALGFLSGCGKEKPEASSSEAPRHSPESYMKDPAFRKSLADKRSERGELAKARNIVVARMTEMIEAKLKEKGIDKPTDADLDAIKVELERDPEWKSLYQRCLDANQAIQDNLKQAQAIARQRITPRRPQNQKISK